jgi:hypothetical protein
MAPRLNKRQQRELEELAMLEGVAPDAPEEKLDEEDAGPVQPKASGFAAVSKHIPFHFAYWCW